MHGYTGFRFRVDPRSSTLASLRSGLAPTVLLAIRVDPRANEGWFYEGGGIYSHAWLVTTAESAYILPQGVHATAVLDSRVVRLSTGFATAAATVTVVTELEGVSIGHSFGQGEVRGEITRPLSTGDAEQAEAVSLLECVTTQNEYNMM